MYVITALPVIACFSFCSTVAMMTAKLNLNIQPEGGVPMTGEGILFCFSMLFLILFLLGSC